MNQAPALAITLLALAACGSKSPNEAQADRLDNAAEQSTPAAAEVLHNAADEIRENGATGAPSEPGSTAQEALKNAAKAQSYETQAPMPGAPPVEKQAPPTPPATGR